MQVKITMTIINPSLHSNTKRTHPNEAKSAAIAADFLWHGHSSRNTAKKGPNKDLKEF